MTRLNKKQQQILEKEYKKDRTKRFLVILTSTIPFLGFALLIYAFSWASEIQNNIEGIAKELKVTSYHDKGVKILMKVELKNGKKVNVAISSHQLFKKDHELLLSKKTPPIGLSSYTFLKYKN